MTLPVFDSAKHDLGLNSVGYMVAPQVPVQRTDAVASTSRAALGEGRYDEFQVESYAAMSDWGGGSGQGRLKSPDQYLSGIGDGRFQGHYFPARKKITESDGGTTSWYFTNNGTLYGMTAGFIETIGSAGSQARTTGTIYCKPVESGSHNNFWVQDDSGTRKIGKWTGSGATSFVTPTGVTPYLVYPHGRFMWCIGTQTVTAQGSLVQSNTRSFVSTATQCVTSLTTAPKVGNVVVVGISVSGGSSTVTPSNSTDGWIFAEQINSGAMSIGSATVSVYYKVVTKPTDGQATFTVSGSGSAMIVAELTGIDVTSPFMDSNSSNDNTADTSEVFPSISAGTYGAVLCFGANDATDTSLTGLTNSFSTITGVSYAAAAQAFNLAYKFDTTSVTTTGTISSGGDVSVTVGLRPSALATDQTQTMFYYTTDEGSSWTAVFNAAGAGIPVPKAVHTAGGYAWVTTERKLYQVGLREREFEDHLQSVTLAIDDVDTWSIPKDTASIGTWIADFGGQIFYNVGATIRSYSPGADTGQQIWPSKNWDGIAGEVQSIVQGEGGIYFGSSGYLWCYNQQGFWELAAEPAADDFDYTFWHQGRFYFNDDPAGYFDFKYPSSRPDVSYTAATNFTTGYLVTSAIDLEKANEYKLARQFETQAQFTTTSNAGTITLEYLIADSGLHPEGLGGGATSLTWTSIGTHTVSDGNIKRYTLGTIAEFKKIYLRVTLAVGSSGYPILENLIINGRSLMPPVKRITATVALNTAIRDRQGSAPLYPDEATVQEAIDALETLRNPTGSPRYFTAAFVKKSGTTDSYTVTIEQLTESILGFSHADGMAAAVQIAMLEIP